MLSSWKNTNRNQKPINAFSAAKGGCGSDEGSPNSPERAASASPSRPSAIVKLRHSFSLGLADAVRLKNSAFHRSKESLNSPRLSPASTPSTPTSTAPSFRVYPAVGEEDQTPVVTVETPGGRRKHYGRLFLDVDDAAARWRHHAGL